MRERPTDPVNPLPIEWSDVVRDPQTGEVLEKHIWTPPPRGLPPTVANGDGGRAVGTAPADGAGRSLSVVYQGTDRATDKKLREAFEAQLAGRTCRHCRFFLDDPKDREARKATFLAWQVLMKDLDFANHHFDVEQYAPCLAHFEDSAAAFTTADSHCEDFKKRGGGPLSLLRRWSGR